MRWTVLTPVEALRDREQLQAYVAGGGPVRYLFFWGHRRRADGTVGKGCLSQWYEAPFSLDGHLYPTAEHFMMASKARLFGDEAMASKILQTPDPKAAKALGRKVQGFDEAQWVAARFDLVVQGNLAKFSQHPELGAFLRASQNRVIVEASPADTLWGIGLAEDDPDAMHPARWKGLNLLGFALMAVRAALQEKEHD